MKAKIDVRRSFTNVRQEKQIQEDSMFERADSNNEKNLVRISTNSLPPLESIMKKKGKRNTSMLISEFNKPLPMLWPVESSDVPMLSDHVGYCPPHRMNLPKAHNLQYPESLKRKATIKEAKAAKIRKLLDQTQLSQMSMMDHISPLGKLMPGPIVKKTVTHEPTLPSS